MKHLKRPASLIYLLTIKIRYLTRPLPAHVKNFPNVFCEKSIKKASRITLTNVT